MSKGLKQAVQDAVRSTGQEAAPEVPPVRVSGEALHALSIKMREWSGWDDASVHIGVPVGSPYANCNHNTHVFTANADRLVLNPNRVLLTLTPFRLRQEAVLTGALLHEAGHARFSRWRPRSTDGMAEFTHADGKPVSKAVLSLAVLMEEARIEGLMAKSAEYIGARDLDWTMRAAAAHLVPMTTLAADPNQKLMDLITSWALRAGRQLALYKRGAIDLMPGWVGMFSSLLHNAVVGHLSGIDADSAFYEARGVNNNLLAMLVCDDHTGTTMVDLARTVLETLFPETDPEDQPQAGAGCAAVLDDEAESEEGEQGEDESQAEEAEQESGGGEAQSEADEPGDGDSEGEGEPDEDDTDAEDSDTDSEDGDGASDSTEAQSDTSSDLAQALAELEAQAQQQAEDEAEEQTKQAPSGGAGSGSDGEGGGGWRDPTKHDRAIQHNAETFLRSLIAPSESSTITLTESPSATVDGAALSAWKAGGQIRDPHFFIRTRREVEPSPPVKIAILVDVSGSMDEMQKPSAVLSWALAAASLDLRNFAGRGRQVESCLIHWGDEAEVIQRNGVTLPGIREVACRQGTSAMAAALDLVAQELPGFFDLPEVPEHRLLVQFTDWELSSRGKPQTTDRIHRALAAGVNMLSVVPQEYRDNYRSALPVILKSAMVHRGTSAILRYNPLFPTSVWDHAAEQLQR